MKKLYAMFAIAIMLFAALPAAILPAGAAGPTKTQLTIYTPVSVHSLQAFDVSGKLVASDGAGVPGMTVSVYRSTDGKKWSLIDASQTDGGGNYKVTAIEDTAGKYMYRAEFPGGKVYKPATSVKAIVTVDATKATALTVDVPASAYSDEMWKVRAYLKDAAGNPVAGQPVDIEIDGPGLSETTTVQTAADGLACKSYMDLAVGVYTIQVKFYGSEGYAPTFGIATVEVKEKPLIATVLELNDVAGSIEIGKPISFSGTLTAAGAGVWNKPINIERYNGDTGQWDTAATANTDGAGSFHTTYTENARGTYNYRVVFPGDGQYAGAMSSVRNVYVWSNLPTLTVDATCTDLDLYKYVHKATAEQIDTLGNAKGTMELHIYDYDSGELVDYYIYKVVAMSTLGNAAWIGVIITDSSIPSLIGKEEVIHYHDATPDMVSAFTGAYGSGLLDTVNSHPGADTSMDDLPVISGSVVIGPSGSIL